MASRWFGIEGPVYLTMRGDKGGGEWFVDGAAAED
ncbi:hypothetical protein NC652_019037 [Populus alba x Populus x berolinensis]|nr:hypothetical protein NC652_019037 [Populus alba x Populus x berolinensis]